MKKELFSLLLSAALLVSATACNRLPEKNAEQSNEEIIDENMTNETDSRHTTLETEETSQVETNNDHPPFWDFYPLMTTNSYVLSSDIFCCESSGQLFIRIKSWPKECQIPYSKLFLPYTIVVNGDHALFISPTDDSLRSTLQVIRFEKESEKLTTISTIPLDEGFCCKLYCNFIDEKNGFLFVVYENNDGYRTFYRAFAWKTKDEGNTWTQIPCENPPIGGWHNAPIMAKFVSEQVGVVSFRGGAQPDFWNKTFFTVDGGSTWASLSELSYPSDQLLNICEDGEAEAFEFESIDGIYYLTVNHSVSHFNELIQLRSTDIMNWEIEGYIKITKETRYKWLV